MLRRPPEASHRTAGRGQGRHRVGKPQRGEHLAVGFGGRPCRPLTVTRCRGVQYLGVTRRRRAGGSVGTQPGHHGFWSTDRQALLWHVSLHSIAQIGVELETPGAGAQAAIPGKPEATISSMYSGNPIVDSSWMASRSARTAARLTVGVTRPRSATVMGRMRRRPIRPAPECCTVPSCGLALPVRSNCPPAASSSTARRTTSHTSGTFCHSSPRSGRGRRRMVCGSAATGSRRALESSFTSPAARCFAVVVLPTALVPSSARAPPRQRVHPARGPRCDGCTAWLNHAISRCPTRQCACSELSRTPLHRRGLAPLKNVAFRLARVTTHASFLTVDRDCSRSLSLLRVGPVCDAPHWPARDGRRLHEHRTRYPSLDP